MTLVVYDFEKIREALVDFNTTVGNNVGSDAIPRWALELEKLVDTDQWHSTHVDAIYEYFCEVVENEPVLLDTSFSYYFEVFPNLPQYTKHSNP